VVRVRLKTYQPEGTVARDGRARFRTTDFDVATWPLDRLPVPRAERWRRVRVNGDLLIGSTKGAIAAHLPDELYLRELLDLDVADAQAVATWCGRFGPLGGTDFTLLPAKARPPAEAAYTLDVFRYHAVTLRNLVRTWDAFTSGQAVDALVGGWEPGGARRSASSRADLARVLLRDFGATLSAALVPLHAEIAITPIGVQPGAKATNTYTAMAAQLWNQVVEGEGYRRCANETCGRLFYRQRGRSEHGQHRTTSLRYCSRECARAQVERERRRRQRKGQP
jgi:hypothetical protein